MIRQYFMNLRKNMLIIESPMNMELLLWGLQLQGKLLSNYIAIVSNAYI